MGAAKDPEMSPDAKAAHELLAELRTRISIQPLAYQDGEETAALESLVAIFDHARLAIKKNPGREEFARHCQIVVPRLRSSRSAESRRHLEGIVRP